MHTCQRRYRHTCIAILMLCVFSCSTGPLAQTPPLWGDLEPGPYMAGFRTIEAYDYSRTFRVKYDYFGTLQEGERARPVQICIWYPAKETPDAMPMAYGEYVFPNPEDAGLINFITQLQFRELGLLQFLLNNDRGLVLDVQNVGVGAVRDAPPAEGMFPVIVYFSGIGRGFSENHVMCEFLASHGFVVVSTHSVGSTTPNPQPDYADLEATVRDKEFALAQVRDLECVDRDKLGVMGLGHGGLASLILQMRNTDVEAVAGLDGWNILAERTEFAGQCAHFNPARMSVPLLQMYRGADSLYDFSLLDSCKYSERYLFRFSDTSGASFSSYGAIRGIISDSGDFATTVSRPTYEICCRYLRGFFYAHLSRDETGQTFMAGSPAENGIDPGLLTAKVLPGQDLPPTPIQFIGIIRQRSVREAIEIYKRFQESDPGSITFPEATINALGYQFLQRGRVEDAVELFRLNAEAYPLSANSWDSYADGCLAAGDNESAIRCYKRVLEVLPDDQTASDQLKETLRNNARQGLERLEN